jgi:alpha-tubulin suppressor-like RCC1 family protein
VALIVLLAPAAAAGEQASEPGVLTAGQLDAGGVFSCAIAPAGQVRCWGWNGQGELGYPGVSSVGATDTPASVGPVDIGAGYTATAISSGDYHTCAIRNDGRVVCWGYGAEGRLGYGNTSNVGDTGTPASAGAVDLGGQEAVAITAGGAHTCAILASGQVTCWGFGYDGQLGYGNRNNVGDGGADQSPGAAGAVNLGPGHTALAISAGTTHTCAIVDEHSVPDVHSVYCWGTGTVGELGYGNTNNVGDGGTDASPAVDGPVFLPTGRTPMAISTGDEDTCVILDDGTVRCWGFGFDGQLGYGNQSNEGENSTDTPDMLAPVDLGPGRKAVAISAGSAHTCALLDDGSVECWGYGAYGRLGYGNTSNVGNSPTDTPGMVGPVNLGPGRIAVAITAGGMHTCARLDDGSIRCWGYGANGRLGYCSEANVGDTPSSTPDVFGPVNLIPGDGGEVCAPPAPPGLTSSSLPTISGQVVAGRTLTEGHGSWSPTPTSYAPQWERCDPTGANCGSITGATGQTYTLAAIDVGSTIRVLESVSDGAGSSAGATSAPTGVVKAAAVPNSDAARARSFRACLAAVSASVKHLRALTHPGSKRQRARARRQLARRLAAGRAGCVRRWGRTPGRVTGLKAIARGRTKIALQFSAPGTDGDGGPAATSYVIRQAKHPLRTTLTFAHAPALCHGACRFAVSEIGTKLILTVNNLKPRTSYYYAVAALDNVTARPGPRSPAVEAKTG